MKNGKLVAHRDVMHEDVAASRTKKWPPDVPDCTLRRHATTLWTLSKADLGKLAPPTGSILNTGLDMVEKADRLAIVSPAQSDDVALLDYALGSGKTGMTYVSLVGGDKLAEFRMSYFPVSRSGT